MPSSHVFTGPEGEPCFCNHDESVVTLIEGAEAADQPGGELCLRLLQTIPRGRTARYAIDAAIAALRNEVDRQPGFQAVGRPGWDIPSREELPAPMRVAVDLYVKQAAQRQEAIHVVRVWQPFEIVAE